MDLDEEIIRSEPVSPSSQYLRSSALSLTIIAVMESEIPIDDSMAYTLLNDLFLPINPRFSSLMITKRKGEKKWKRVKVNLKDHINVPKFPDGLSVNEYDEYFTNYMSKIGMEELPEDRPLWEIHIIKYPTSNSAGNLIFKLHHSLGDGYSLMGALLSCLQRLDDPSLPITFPSRQSHLTNSNGRCHRHHQQQQNNGGFFSRIFNTIRDFGFTVLKSTLIADDQSPLRSGVDRVEFRPITLITMAFSLDRIKPIKNKLNVTVNDVITGVIMYGTRLYMEAMNNEGRKAKVTALVLLNTRAIGGYKSVSEMLKPNAEMPWGNHFAFLPISVPKLSALKSSNPLRFLMDAHKLIKNKRNSAAVLLTGKLLEAMRKIKGSEATARFVHGTLKNSTMAISNLIGPVEKLALANHPVKGMYFTVAGAPQSLSVTIISYVGTVRVAFGVEKDYIDPSKFKSCIHNAFETIFQAATETTSTIKS
ncbi:hypothetical protein M9H77_29740 [Catharanthus roseus]|uniref:Uncharacterized protein n=1 Tax=Catharanthus roseus TaxID=4058 RepID=A0ACB9ZZI7_CATRO|nr:hypothetical protein M9H77_29740 [Catharanthus roseus]